MTELDPRLCCRVRDGRAENRAVPLPDHCPIPDLSAGQVSDLQSMTRRLLTIDFSEATVAQVLDLPSLTERRIYHRPAYRRLLKSQGALGTAIAYWLLQEYVSLDDLRATVGDHALSTLHSLGWMEVDSRGLRSHLDLYPCQGLYFFTDPLCNLNVWPEQVYWLGEDSYALAYTTPRSSRGRSLDICSGSGVHAVLAGAHCPRQLAADINPRALQVGRVNAQLNHFPEVEFRSSDCFAAFPQDRFDLITLNPPFVPAPSHILDLYRTGGGSGESVTEKVVRGLPHHLNEGGLFCMTTEAPQRGDETPVHRCNHWLGSTANGSQTQPTPNWGVAALYERDFAVDHYIYSHVLATQEVAAAEREQEFERWLDTYQSLGVTAMRVFEMFALRLPAGSPGWNCEHSFPHPSRDCSDLVQRWLESVQSWHQSWPNSVRPRLDAQVAALYYAEDSVMVEWVDTRWSLQPLRLGAEQARLLKSVQQGASLGQIRQAQPQAQQLLLDLAAELVVEPVK